MNRGPQPGALQGQRSYVDKAVDAWGEVPDWVAELAIFADRHGAKPAGAAIGYSNSVISVVINKGSGFANFDLARIEEAVRGALMGLTVECPVLGDIGRDQCLQEQKEPFRSTSAHRAQLFHACRGGCPNSRLKGEINAE